MSQRLLIGVLNTDNPEFTKNRKESDRFGRVQEFLIRQDCDLLLLFEANSAMRLDGYAGRFSVENPFVNVSRSAAVPNVYHQVGIYSRLEGTSVYVNEPINGLKFRTTWGSRELLIYASVMTIKDRWSKTTNITYLERVDEQLMAMSELTGKSFIVGGDFNCRNGSTTAAYEKIGTLVDRQQWIWPTRDQKKTVQHVVHSNDIANRGGDSCLQ